MTTIKKIWNKHYFSISLFLFLLVYSVVIPGKLQPWKIFNSSLAFHAVDFSMGFCTKFLPGAIYNIFFDTVNYTLVSAYESVLLIIFFACVCFYLEKFLLSLKPEYRKTGIILSLLLITGPGTFSNYIVCLGMLDVYWLFGTALFLLFLSKKELNLLIIPLAVCAILVHYAGIFCYVPFFAILVLYKLSCAKKGSGKVILLITFLLTTIVSIAFTLYMVVNEKYNTVYSYDEFSKIVTDKGADYLAYYQFGLYRELEEFYGVTIQSDSIFEMIYWQIQSTIYTFMGSSGYWVDAITVILLILPVVIITFRTFGHLIKKNKENKLKQFSFVCMILLFFMTLISGVLFSSDFIRWISHAFLPMLVSLFYVIYIEKDEAISFVKGIFDKIPRSVFIIFFIIYAISSFSPYF